MTALITGASSGIGAAFAARLAEQGHDLVAVARTETALQEQADALRRRHGVAVQVLAADLSTPDGQDRVRRRIAEPTNTEPPVQMLVNNAGGATTPDFADTDPDALRALLELNVASVQELMRAALPGMLARRHGAVVNVSSLNAYLSLPGGAAAYGASKSYVTELTKAVALTLTDTGVRVMALCPGPTRTSFGERNGTHANPLLAWMIRSPHWVVDQALADLHRGRSVCLPGLATKAVAAVGAHIPTRLATPAIRTVRTLRKVRSDRPTTTVPRIRR